MVQHNEGVDIDLAAGTLTSPTWSADVSSIESAYGSAHDDHLAGDGGPNTLAGMGNGPDGDLVEGRGGNDALDAEGGFASEPTGIDEVYGGDGNDRIAARIGADIAYGGEGNDDFDGSTLGNINIESKTFYGEAGDDWLQGSIVDDHLLGGAGVDTFHGFDGEDTCDVEPGETAHSCELSPE